MNVDFSKAPGWAIGHALHAFGGEIREVWVGEHQYQRLDQLKAFPYGGGNSDHRHNPRRSEFYFEQLRPAPWTGEGLPPVGTVCEWHPNVHGGVEVTILGHDGEDTWYRVKGEDHTQTCRNMAFFRTIRTPEQIAAEERQKEIVAIGDILIANRGNSTEYLQAGLLYDAGYRKQVAP